jgi:signal transduction histidine kinase
MAPARDERDQLMARVQVAEEFDRLRADFMARVSHELRTPLTAAQAALSLLDLSAHDRLHPDERDLLSNAHRNIRLLGLHIADLLTVDQLDAGTLPLERVSLHLRAVVTGAVAVVQPLLRQKEQVLELQVDLPESLLIEGDPRRLEQVVVNLLANAHQHTPSGTRIVLRGGVTGRGVHLTVSDNGPGIPAEDLETVFQPFHRLDVAGGGSGLGLAIARGIVELHGGRIWAESRLGAGTALHVVLPLATADAQDARP